MDYSNEAKKGELVDMTAEAIIQQIKKDAEQEITNITKETQEKINEITAHIQKQTDEKRKLLLEKGKQEAENIEKIELSKAHQEAKRQQMQTKERLIETCFQQAFEHLAGLKNDQYTSIIERYLQKGRDQINDSFSIYTSKPLDKTIAKKQNIPVKGTIQATGGIKMISENGDITIDSTFEGILKKRKQDIRVQVGSILFP